MCKDSYVFGVRGVFSGEMEGGIFRKGRATKMAKFEKEVLKCAVKLNKRGSKRKRN